VGGYKKPGSTGKHENPVTAVPKPVGTEHRAATAKGPNEVSKITVVYDSKTSRGTLYAQGQDGSTKLKADVVVVGDGHVTPTGTFHASDWEKDHVSQKYGSYANTPWSKSPLGINAFGPYQLHIRELEKQGIYVHGTMGPSWTPAPSLNTLLSPTSHGCVRMGNSDNLRLHELLPNPSGTEIKISTDPKDTPKAGGKP